MRRRLTDIVIPALVAFVTAGAFHSLMTARATQEELVPPTSGIFTGVQFSQLIGDAMRSLASQNKGSSAPANVSGAAVDGLPWLDDSATPWALKYHADGDWVTAGFIDDVNGRWVGVLGGGVASLASASTADLGSVAPANVTITGTTTITSFGSSAPTGVMKVVRFEGALTLTHSAGLLVPGGYSLTTAASDRAIVTHLGSGAWEITQYTRASGVPIDVADVGKIKFGLLSGASDYHVAAYGQALSRATYPAYLAKVTRTQNTSRISGDAQISVVSTAGLGAGMPIEGTGIGAGCTISSVTGSTTLILSSASCVTSTGSATSTVFLTGYGSGGSSTTVGAPDCRGHMLAGLDTLPGSSAAGRITLASSGIPSTVIGGSGGSDAPTALLQSHLPNVTLTTSGSTVSGSVSVSGVQTIGGGGVAAFNSGLYASANVSTTSTNVTVPLAGSVQALDALNLTGSISSGSFSGTTSSLNAGGQGTIGRMPPTLMAQCDVRVTP